MEALTAVFADIDARGITEVHCLGDVVGYGPEPEAVCDLVRSRCTIVLRGNHDDAIFGDARRFNVIAREAISYTRQRLKPGLVPNRKVTERWEWLSKLVPAAPCGDALFVHGSPRDPLNEYVYREDVLFNADTKLKDIFARHHPVTFCGHTHMPMVISDAMLTFVPRDGAASCRMDPRRKYIVNVGSVGQPRDRDPRACYAEVDNQMVTFHRVAYDIAATQKKIRAIPELNELLASRLEEGI